MRRIEVWLSDDGNLEQGLDRAKAHDLHAALPKCSSNPNAKVLGWSECLRIIENADVVLKHLEEFVSRRDSTSKD